jgi:hypothetical protein
MNVMNADEARRRICGYKRRGADGELEYSILPEVLAKIDPEQVQRFIQEHVSQFPLIMATKTLPLTLDEHKEIAARLHKMRAEASAIEGIVFPKVARKSRWERSISRLLHSVDETKCLLDRLMHSEHPEAPEPSFYLATPCH